MHYIFERLERAAGSQTKLGPKETLQLDILRQIQCIVASRPWQIEDERADREPHLLAFGMGVIPDLARGSTLQLGHYAERLKRLIARYEPRLDQASVTLEPTNNPASPLKVVVSGFLRQEDLSRPAQPLRFEAWPPAH